MNTPRSPFYKTSLKEIDNYPYIYDFPTKPVPIALSNPSNNHKQDYFKYKKDSDKVSCIQLTDKEEFYQIYGVDTILEDHRLINYVWNLKYLITLNSKSSSNFDYSKPKWYSPFLQRLFKRG